MKYFILAALAVMSVGTTSFAETLRFAALRVNRGIGPVPTSKEVCRQKRYARISVKEEGTLKKTESANGFYYANVKSGSTVRVTDFIDQRYECNEMIVELNGDDSQWLSVDISKDGTAEFQVP